jgi:acyl-CoA thioesterase I
LSLLFAYTNNVDVRRRCIVSFLALLLVAPAFAADRPVLVCFGDSITAGYGLETGHAYPDFLQEKLDKLGYHYTVSNQGTSGATTKDAVADLRSILQLHPEIVIVEFGGNDGLRGLPTTETRKNLDNVLTTLENAHIKILLAGITLPPDYGPDYIHSFEQVFSDLAAKHHTAFVPMIYKDLIHVPNTIQQDGIHPTSKGSNILADTMFAALRPLLRKQQGLGISKPPRAASSWSLVADRKAGKPAPEAGANLQASRRPQVN